jgi:hypothetical protein
MIQKLEKLGRAGMLGFPSSHIEGLEAASQNMNHSYQFRVVL